MMRRHLTLCRRIFRQTATLQAIVDSFDEIERTAKRKMKVDLLQNLLTRFAEERDVVS